MRTIYTYAWDSGIMLACDRCDRRLWLGLPCHASTLRDEVTRWVEEHTHARAVLAPEPADGCA